MAVQVTELDRLRFYASVFSRSFFTEVMKSGGIPFTFVERVRKYDSAMLEGGKTLGNCLRAFYARLARCYRSEYVYKNMLLRMLMKEHSKRETVVFSEFLCGDSYADLVMFNGTSRVYEIKTELDSPARLGRQLANYKSFFQYCYLVTHESQAEKYGEIDPEVGIIALVKEGGKQRLKEWRPAPLLERVDVDVLMRTLHTAEYKSLVRTLCGELPPVGAFRMYAACAEMLRGVESAKLQKACVELLKKRGRESKCLWDYSKSTSMLLQLCLALHVKPAEYERLKNILNCKIYS